MAQCQGLRSTKPVPPHCGHTEDTALPALAVATGARAPVNWTGWPAPALPALYRPAPWRCRLNIRLHGCVAPVSQQPCLEEPLRMAFRSCSARWGWEEYIWAVTLD